MMEYELINAYISVSKELGKDEPTLTEFQNHSQHTRTEVYDVFDSFTNLKHKALFEQGKKLYKQEGYLRQEYVDKRRSMHEIANEWDTQDATIDYWIKKHGIESRSRSEARSEGDVRKLHDKKWLQKEYIDKHCTGPEIADKCGVGAGTVYRWLEKHNIEIREKGISRSNGTTAKLRDREWLKQKYEVDELSTIEIAEICGCSKHAVLDWLCKHGIERRAGGRDMSSGNLERLNNPIYLTQAHHEQKMTTVEIAKKLNVAASSVIRKMNEFGIKTYAYQSDTADYDKLNDAEYLRTQYIKKKKSASQIAKDCDCSRHTVTKRLKKIGVEIERFRDNYHQDGLKFAEQVTDGDIKRLYDEEWVKEQYVDNEKSMLQIADDLGLSTGAVINALRRYDIEARDYPEAAPKGPDHHKHKSVDTGYYGPNWEDQKLKARIRDHCKCQVCGINDRDHLEKYGRVNSVHHITPRSYYVDENGVLDHEQANRIDNLITLCSDHHPEYEDVPIDNRKSC